MLKMGKRKLKSSAKNISKIIMMIVSLCGLIYQVQIIFNQYMSGKTIICLEIGSRISDESPPAITFCYHGLFSMERAAKFDPGFKKVNEKYQKLMRRGFYGKAAELC